MGSRFQDNGQQRKRRPTFKYHCTFPILVRNLLYIPFIDLRHPVMDKSSSDFLPKAVLLTLGSFLSGMALSKTLDHVLPSWNIWCCPSLGQSKTTKRVAVLLAGAGFYDGSEITEAVSVLVHLDKLGANVTMFAPALAQHHVINHISGAEMAKAGKTGGSSRQVLLESARIARGNIQNLSTIVVSEFDALIIPGGFGVAKNLSTFAFDGTDMMVLPKVEAVLKEFHSAKKPIGFCCVAPILGAKLFPGAELTVGKRSPGDEWPYAGTSDALESMGATVVEKEKSEFHVDVTNKFVSAPAYMCATTPNVVFENLGKLVKATLALA